MSQTHPHEVYEHVWCNHYILQRKRTCNEEFPGSSPGNGIHFALLKKTCNEEFTYKLGGSYKLSYFLNLIINYIGIILRRNLEPTL